MRRLGEVLNQLLPKIRETMDGQQAKAEGAVLRDQGQAPEQAGGGVREDKASSQGR